MAHIGDRDIEGMGCHIKVDSIIKIFCSDGVNRTKIKMCQINSFRMIYGIDIGRYRFGFFDALLRKSILSMVESK